MKGLLALLAPKGGGSGKEDAAQDLLDAIADKDAKAVALAFEALYEHCSDKGHDDEDEEDGDY
jgi:hypothetical protein